MGDELEFNPYYGVFPYHDFVKEEGIPVHEAYAVDCHTLAVEPWERLGGLGAYIHLVGRSDYLSAYVVEIPPGGQLNVEQHMHDELMHVISGRGATVIEEPNGKKHSFEWGPNSIFGIPLNAKHQLFNGSGTEPARLAAVTDLPIIFNIFHRKEFIFDNPFVDTGELYGDEEGFYAHEAHAIQRENGRTEWYGNFFPDLTIWDNLTEYGGPGRLALSGGITFPQSAHRPGLMVLPSRRYRAAHRHGPGVTIIGIQEARGFVVMWPPGGGPDDYILTPWQEGSVFVPPNMWYHQHINSGPLENRQLRLFPPRPIMNYSFVDPKQWIPFTEEDPWIRQKFEEDLANQNLTSLMPEEAYVNPDFEWPEDFLKDKD